MEDEAARLLLLEEEREGDQEGSDDFVFRRIGESVPLFSDQSSFDLQSPPFKPLSISNRFGALFIAHSEGFLVIKTKDAINLAKEVKEKGKGPCINNSSLLNVQIGRVSLLEISNDSSMLATAINGDIHFFSVSSLLKKDPKPLFSCSLSKSGAVKDFKWLEKGAKSYLVLSDYGSLYQGDFKGEMKDILDSVDAVDCSPDGKSIAIIRKNNFSIFSLNFEEYIRMPLSFESWSDSENINIDSIGWVQDNCIIIGAMQLNDNGDEEGYFVHLITSGDKNFLESSCKPVAISFPNLFEGLLDDIIPSGFGPHLFVNYLDKWDLLLTSNKKNVDQHVVLLKWSFNEDKNEVVSLEFQNDKYTPRIDLQENGDDNTIVGFGVEKVSLFEKITIQSGTDMQELAPQYIMACLTCEGKLIMYYVARASDPSELPQHDISSFEESEFEPVNTGEDGLEVKIDDQVKIQTAESKIAENKVPESKILENKVPESEVPTETSSPFKPTFGMGTQNIPGTIPSETSSPFKPTVGMGTQNVPGTILSETSSPFKATFGTSTQNVPSTTPSVTSSPFKSTFGMSSQNIPSTTPSETTSPFKPTFGMSTQNVPSSTTPSETSSPFKTTFGMGTQNAPSPTPSETSSPFKPTFGMGTQNAPSTTPSETTSPFKGAFGMGTQTAPNTTTSEITSPFKGAFGFGSPVKENKEQQNQITSAFKGSFGSNAQVAQTGTSLFQGGFGSGTRNAPTTQPFSQINNIPKETTSPFKGAFGTAFNADFSQKEGFKPFSGPSLKLGSSEPSNNSENRTSFGFGSISPKQNIDKKPENIEGISRNFVKPTTKEEKESEPGLHSVKDIINELDNLFSDIEKQVGFTSQQNILLELDQNLKNLSQLSLSCKNDVEEQLEMMQDLRDNMSQVSSRQVYMESIVKQSSDKKYLEVWNSQKLGSEFEIKRQNILKASQNLTNQLVELERHFNNLEIKEFGEVGRVGFNRRNLSSTRSKPAQSLHSVYNTLNSQLATAEQLSNALSKQISVLKITSPSPPVTKRAGSVKKLLFESIGLSYEQPGDSYMSPGFTRSGPGSSSVKRGSVIKGSEIETSRRRRDSLDRSWSCVEPQKTTVKRKPSEHKQQTPPKIFSIGSDKKFKSKKEILNKAIEPTQTTGFITKFTPPTRDNEEKTPNQGPTPQQSSVFKWARESSSSPPNTESKPQFLQDNSNKPPSFTPEPPKFSLSFESPSSSTTKPFSNVSLVKGTNLEAKSQPGQPTFGFKTGEATSKPLTFSFNLSTKPSETDSPFVPKPIPSIFETTKDKSSTETVPAFAPKPIPSLFGKPSESETAPTFAPKPIPSLFGKPSETENVPKPAPSIFGKPTEPENVPKPVPSIFGKPNEPDKKDNKAIPETIPPLLKFGTGSPEKPVQVPIPATSSPPKPVPAPTTISSPPKPESVPTEVSPPSKPVPSPVQIPTPASGPTSQPSTTSSSFVTPPVSSPVQFSIPASGPTLQPSTTSSSFSTPASGPTPSLKLPPLKDEEDEMEEEAPETATTELNFGSLGGFGLGSGSSPNQPKPNPFGASLFNTNNTSSPTQTLTPSTLTSSPGSLFRPASLSFPSPQPSPPGTTTTTPFSGSGFTGFGQPAQVGSTGFGQPAQVGSTGFGQPAQVGSGFGQPAQVGSGFGQPAQVGGGFGQPAQVGSLGSVLGAFGQSRQFGAGLGSNTGSQPTGLPSTGGFGGFASATTGGGFAAAATGGGFAAAATGGGFAAAATGGGFAGAATSGGFGGFGSTGGGFAGAGQSGGFAGAFGGQNNNQGSGFSAFGGTGPGRPPAVNLFSQMRK